MSEPTWVSYATTEPGAGSDVAGMQCRAVKQSDGSYVLTGTKAWITNANFASFYVIFATENPELRHKGIGAFIVHRDAKGLSIGKHEDKLGQRASDTAQVMLEGVHVPPSQVLAPPGHGFKVAMETFNQTRPDIGAIAVGLMRRCLDESVAYAKERKTFGTPIANHQLVQAMLAEMAIRIHATRLLVHKAAWALDKGVRDPLTSSLAKAYGADAAMQSATDAVQVFGGNGYVKEYPVEKLMRDAKILQIYEGTAQIQRIVIAKQLLA
jgi:acyl-CoA dehydrogenase